VFENPAGEGMVFSVPWARELSSANDEARRREAKHNSTKPLLLAQRAIY
jgi:hypothetical protein